MQRLKETHKEISSLMRTLHPLKFSREELLLGHETIGRQSDQMTFRLVENLSRKFSQRRAPWLWKGIFAEFRGDLLRARHCYRKAIRMDQEGLDWQPQYRLNLVEEQVSQAYYPI